VRRRAPEGSKSTQVRALVDVASSSLGEKLMHFMPKDSSDPHSFLSYSATSRTLTGMAAEGEDEEQAQQTQLLQLSWPASLIHS
jgi:hypothetical protein